jgi:hypothetical protein
MLPLSRKYQLFRSSGSAGASPSQWRKLRLLPCQVSLCRHKESPTMAVYFKGRKAFKRIRRFTVLFLAVVCLLSSGGASLVFAQQARRNTRVQKSRLERYQEQHRVQRQKLEATLTDYARFCDRQGLAEEAARVRKLLRPVVTQMIHIDSLPAKVQPDISVNLPQAERTWRIQVRHAQKEYVKELYKLSRSALHAGSPSYAYQLVREVAAHDPDHTTARRLLGYVRSGDDWLTPFAAEKARRRFVWHDTFGWLLQLRVKRYENGERYFKGRWISSAKEAELRRDFRNAWEVDTDHFHVKTNHSLERGVEIATALEEYYRVFFQTFAAFFNTPEQLQKLFEGNARGRRRSFNNKQYIVHYYRTRDEYNQQLVKKIPQIGITNGLYYPADRIAYFFHNPQATDNSTLYHEATHQLFYENELRRWQIGERKDFWIIEGIACYMESFRRENGRFSLENPLYTRFVAARHRFLVDKYYVPLERFASMGMHEFQTDPSIARNYSQASGLTQFFMEYKGGKYRDALIEHLTQLYRQNPRSRTETQSLAELTGTSFTELDKQYGEFLKKLENDLAIRKPPAIEPENILK